MEFGTGCVRQVGLLRPGFILEFAMTYDQQKPFHLQADVGLPPLGNNYII